MYHDMYYIIYLPYSICCEFYLNEANIWFILFTILWRLSAAGQARAYRIYSIYRSVTPPLQRHYVPRLDVPTISPVLASSPHAITRASSVTCAAVKPHRLSILDERRGIWVLMIRWREYRSARRHGTACHNAPHGYGMLPLIASMRRWLRYYYHDALVSYWLACRFSSLSIIYKMFRRKNILPHFR